MANNFTIEIKDLDKLKKAFKQSPQIVRTELGKAIKISVNIIKPIMQTEVPYKTGKLRQNITAFSSGLSGRVGPNLKVTPYALAVHNGTGPYIIRPKTKKALWWPGLSHPVKMVRHPGIKANPFIERTVDKVDSPINKIFGNSIDKIINKLIK